jgi:hypothetical protein
MRSKSNAWVITVFIKYHIHFHMLIVHTNQGPWKLVEYLGDPVLSNKPLDTFSPRSIQLAPTPVLWGKLKCLDISLFNLNSYILVRKKYIARIPIEFHSLVKNTNLEI